MSGLLCALANRLWYYTALGESRAFEQAVRHPAQTQERLLLDLLRRNASTDFGRRHGFASIGSVAEFQRRIPLSDFDDYAEAIERIKAGEIGVLTAEPVLLLERTSGSTAASKLIPYTASLKAEFQRAIGPWIVDLFRANPMLMNGHHYWSISPVARRGERTAGGVPIGFEEDQEYLGFIQRRLFGSVMAVPSPVRLLSDIDSFRYVTLLFLLRSGSLTLVSVWNPTFLTLLVRPLATWWEQLADDLDRGTLNPPGPIGGDVAEQLRALNRPDPARARAVRAAFAAGGHPGAVHARLWPELRLVSCWADGHATPYVDEVRRLFPQARVQGKGLIATESFVSFPLVGRAGPVPALCSHFFEFIPASGGEPLLVHQLAPGQRYSVVVTTGGGLYRYRLHDLVEVVGQWQGAPLLRFVGKAAHVSDRFGEKVNEQHVAGVLVRLFPQRPAFAMVACEEWEGAWAYTLFVEDPALPDQALALAAGELEEALLENFHYRYCRDLGQLAPVRAFRVTGGGSETYLSHCEARGQRLGDIKPVALHRQNGWRGAFAGYLVQ